MTSIIYIATDLQDKGPDGQVWAGLVVSEAFRFGPGSCNLTAELWWRLDALDDVLLWTLPPDQEEEETSVGITGLRAFGGLGNFSHSELGAINLRHLGSAPLPSAIK